MATVPTRGKPRPCKGCEATIYKSVFCSAVCRNRHYAKGARPASVVRLERRLAATRQCEECGTGFIRPGGKTSANDGRFCSKPCAFAEARRGMAIRDAEAQAKREVQAQARKERQGKRCRDCGVRVMRGAQRCPDCRATAKRTAIERAKLTEAWRTARRAAKARRRAVERGAQAERFDPFEIFERDGWRCHLCRCATPMKYRGSYRPNAPELDHIVPLSKGGKHTRANTACSCRQCNGAKADRIMGQPSLFAAA